MNSAWQNTVSFNCRPRHKNNHSAVSLLGKHLKYMQFSCIACCAVLACMYIHWWSKALCKKIRQGERVQSGWQTSALSSGCPADIPIHFTFTWTLPCHISKWLRSGVPNLPHAIRGLAMMCDWEVVYVVVSECVGKRSGVIAFLLIPWPNCLMQANRQLNTNDIRLRRCTLKEMLCPKVNNKWKSIF